MIKKSHNRPVSIRNLYRVNERVFAQTLRVLDAEGKQIGVLSKFDALAKAREEGLDLVEVAPQAKPPVAKIIDFNKFLYQTEKKKREEKRKVKVSETKEVRLGPFMGAADLENMRSRAEGFLKDGNKVRLVLKFRGRQVTHPEFGYEIIKKMADGLSEVSKIERDPRLEGKQMIAILSPGRQAPVGKEEENAEEKNKELSNQTV